VSAPSFCVRLTVTDAGPQQLRRSVQSLLEQDTQAWQLLLVTDPATPGETLRAVEEVVSLHGRARHLRSPEAGPVAAGNVALDAAFAQLSVQLPVGDGLSAGALSVLGHAFVEQPDLDLAFGDTREVDHAGRTVSVRTRPGWSPALLVDEDYLGGCVAVRTQVALAVGGLRPGTGTGAEWDLHLRVAERARRVRHLPLPLHETTGAVPAPDPQARQAVLTGLVARRGWRASVQPGDDGEPAVVLAPRPSTATVSVVIPTAGAHGDVDGERVRLVDACVDGVLSPTTGVLQREVIVVLSEGTDAVVRRELTLRWRDAVRFVQLDQPWTFSLSVNAGAVQAEGELLLLLNDDVLAPSRGWLDRLAGHLQEPDVGAAGPLLLYPDGTVQHAGIIGWQGVPALQHRGRTVSDGGPWGELRRPRDVLALTGACLLTRRTDYLATGGMSEDFPVSFNDVDYCLRLRERGQRCVLDPRAVLRHHESATRSPVVTVDEMARLTARWGAVLGDDPYLSSPRQAELSRRERALLTDGR